MRVEGDLFEIEWFGLAKFVKLDWQNRGLVTRVANSVPSQLGAELIDDDERDRAAPPAVATLSPLELALPVEVARQNPTVAAYKTRRMSCF
jgi:hypothetical protein